MRLLNKIGFLASLLLLSVACSSEQELKMAAEQQEIRFNYFLQEGNQTIPLGRSVDGVSRALDNDLTTGFELYAVWNTKDMPTTFTKGSNTSTENGIFFFDNQRMDWNTTSSSYEYAGDKRYWIADGKTRHSFAARSVDPLITVSGHNKGGSTQKGFTTTRWIPSIDYYVHPDPKQQHDLLVASGPMNVVVRNATPTVNLYFKHALSKVRFNILSSAGATLYGVELKITYVGVLRHRYSHSFTAEEESASSGTAANNLHYVLTSNLVVPASASDERTAYTAGEFLVQPQTPSSSWLELTISYSLVEGAIPKTAKIGIPSGITFKPGMQYTYYIRVADQPETLTITHLQLEPWTTEYKEVDPL